MFAAIPGKLNANLWKTTCRLQSYEEVAIKLPKFESETELTDNQLVDFCKARGAKLAFTTDADFGVMSDEMNLFITDIIQKTKIKVEEKGIEATAATAIMMEET